MKWCVISLVIYNIALIEMRSNETFVCSEQCDRRQPPWIIDNIKSSLKQRSKLTKISCKNGLRKSDHIKVLEKSTVCIKKVLNAKRNYITKMTIKLEDSNILQMASSTIKRCLLCHLYQNQKKFFLSFSEG